MTNTRDKGRLYDDLLAGLPVGLFLVDEDLNIMDFNPAAEGMTGWRKEEVLGRPCREIMGKGICDEDIAMSEEAGDSEGYLPRETMVKTKSGRMIGVYSIAAPFFEEGSRYAGGVALFFDASVAKKREAEKTSLISMFTHDLKSPVAVVGGIIIRLLEGKGGDLNEKQHKYLALAKNEIVKLDNYIHGFLDALRFETRQIPLYLMPCSLEKLLYDLAEAGSIKAAEKNIRLLIDIPGELSVINIDQTQFQRALTNLLDNALKYSPEGTEVIVRATDKGDSILVEVRDKGYGIAAADMPHLFEPLFRCRDQAHTTVGTGLGLAIAKGIIEAHGGRIWVKSRLGKGSSFFVSIPKQVQTAA